jgi:hypothetical protein
MRVAEWQPEHDKGDESGARPYFAPGNGSSYKNNHNYYCTVPTLDLIV